VLQGSNGQFSEVGYVRAPESVTTPVVKKQSMQPLFVINSALKSAVSSQSVLAAVYPCRSRLYVILFRPEAQSLFEQLRLEYRKHVPEALQAVAIFADLFLHVSIGKGRPGLAKQFLGPRQVAIQTDQMIQRDMRRIASARFHPLDLRA
jgi:hypothetical protein